MEFASGGERHGHHRRHIQVRWKVGVGPRLRRQVAESKFIVKSQSQFGNIK
jgi:hypothetical protein